MRETLDSSPRSIFHTMGIIFFSLFVALASAAQTEYGNLIGRFGDTIHDVAGTVYAVDERTFHVRGFTYDGEGPDAFFYVGTTERPAVGGTIIPLQGTGDPLGEYRNTDVTFTMPSGRITDYRWLSVWCRQVNANFGDVTISPSLVLPAPISLGPLGFNPRVHNVHAGEVLILNDRQFQFIDLDYDGAGPAAYFWTGQAPPDSGDTKVPHPHNEVNAILPRYNGDTVTVTLPEGLVVRSIGFIGIWCIQARQNFGHITISNDVNLDNLPPYIERAAVVEPAVPPTLQDNCLILQDDRFHIAWTLDRISNQIILEFRGIIATKEYLAFGISGSTSRTSMIGSDVTVVWFDESDTARAEDYNLNDYSQCLPEEGLGACPDTLQGGIDDAGLISGTMTNGVAVITVQRPIDPTDPLDSAVPTSGDVYVSWGIGGINPTGHTAKHEIRTNGDLTVNFGRASSKCRASLGGTVSDGPVSRNPWYIEPIRPKGNATFVALIGPSGGLRGYQGIVQQVGWGLAWYINGRLIPEIHVKRGNTYTFEIFGGDDENSLGSFHPFYITEDRNGGYGQKTDEEKALENIIVPPVEGPLCEYLLGDYRPEGFSGFLAFKSTLRLNCSHPKRGPGVLTWTVAEDTPDLVYYQCYQHKFFGWKIYVSGTPGLAQMSLTMLLFSMMFALLL